MAEGPHDALVSIDYSPGPIVWYYLRDPMFSCFDTIPECDRHTQTHDDGIYRA